MFLHMRARLPPPALSVHGVAEYAFRWRDPADEGENDYDVAGSRAPCRLRNCGSTSARPTSIRL
jgi:hypothetical protein